MSGTRLSARSVVGVFVVGAISQYVGAAIGVVLFDTMQPTTVAWLRAASAAMLLLAWRRPWRAGLTRRGVVIAAAFGLVTLGMNVAIYEAFARIPMGTAVALEFLGPTLVAVLGSRRRRDLLAVALAAGGVALLAGVQFGGSAAGVLFALLAAALWACYILLGKAVADAGSGLDSLAVGMGVAAVLSAPFILVPQAVANAGVFGDPRTWLLGCGIGLLSTAIPYALDQVVLKQLGQAAFSLLLALLPATAAVVGAVLLAQLPTAPEVAGIALVMAALVTARPSGATNVN